MLTLKKIYTKLLFLGIFFLPFNSYKGIDFLGEFSRESAFLFFCLGLLFFLLQTLLNSKVKFPFGNEVFLWLAIFVFYCFLCSLLNVFDIYGNYFKQTSGIARFIKQFSVLVVLSVFFLIYFWKALKEFEVEKLLFKIRSIFLMSFIILWVYSFFEIIVVVLKKDQFLPVLHLFNYFPFTEVRLDEKYGRISSVSFEPPFLAIYLITIAGWMFSYILTSKGAFKFMPTIGVLLMTFFSGSRTALVVIIIQLLVFLSIILKMKSYRKYFFYFLSLTAVGFTMILIITKGSVLTSINEKLETLNFKENLTKSISNKSRFGIQYSNLMVFKDHPVIGVGYGQQAFHNRNYYPDWATKSNYEFPLMYLNENERSFPPGYNLYIRLMAETGIIGVGLFLFFLLVIFFKVKKIIKYSNNYERVLAIVLYVSFVGFIINWLQVDTFRIFGFWICLALLMCLNNFRTKESNIGKT